MQSIVIEKRLFIGVYLLARQIELSLDRVLIAVWEELVAFFTVRRDFAHEITQSLRDKIVVAGLESHITQVSDNSSACFDPVYSFFLGKNAILAKDILFIYIKLEHCLKVILSPDTVSQELIISMRMDMCRIEKLIRLRLSNKILDALQYVTHFNHSEYLAFKEIPELISQFA